MKTNTTENVAIIWDKCLEIIEQNVSMQSFKTWFLPIKPLFINRNIFSVQVPSKFFHEWIEEHYNTLLRKAIPYVLGRKARLEYVIITDILASFSIDEGSNDAAILSVSSRANEKMISYFLHNPEELKTMDRRLFEEFIAEIFDGFGFSVELTQQSRDGGRDIVAIKNVESKLKYLIECKRPDPGNPIRIKPVRELFGVKQDERATKAILATTSYFTPDAISFSERNMWELELKDFNGIVDWVKDYNTLKGRN